MNGKREYLATAEQIAREAHAGQLYGEQDYIDAHVAPIVGMIARLGYGEAHQAAGWLHDVFEDSDIQPTEAVARGIPIEVVTAAELLTKRKGDGSAEYLGRIAVNPVAVVVKFCDSSHNFAHTVQQTSDSSTALFVRRVHEYAHNLAFLEPLLPST